MFILIPGLPSDVVKFLPQYLKLLGLDEEEQVQVDPRNGCRCLDHPIHGLSFLGPEWGNILLFGTSTS